MGLILSWCDERGAGSRRRLPSVVGAVAQRTIASPYGSAGSPSQQGRRRSITVTTTVYPHIEFTAEGKPFVKGMRIKVELIATIHTSRNVSAE